MRFLISSFAAAVALAACSPSSGDGQDAAADTNASGGDGGTVVIGTVGGHPVVATDAVAMKGVYDSSYPGIVTVFIGNQAGLCPLFNQLATYSKASKANLFEFGFTLGATNSTSTVVVGTYTTNGNPNELDSIGWDSYDGTCNVTHDSGFSAATVTLTSVGDVYAGTFDVTLNGGDHLTGSFSAPLCKLTADAGSGGGDGGAVCLP
jgi:hypothetical protein